MGGGFIYFSQLPGVDMRNMEGVRTKWKRAGQGQESRGCGSWRVVMRSNVITRALLPEVERCMRREPRRDGQRGYDDGYTHRC